MTNKEAVEIIKANGPAERYGVLRQALSKAIRALEREDRREERNNVKASRSSGGTVGQNVSDVPSNLS